MGGRRARPLLTMQHPSHITPRDFDLSPYFEIIKVRARRVRRRAGSQPGVELEQLARGDLDAVGHR